jgi:hypothetical protein
MQYNIMYRDDDLNIILEVRSKKMNTPEFDDFKKHYRAIGFYGEFIQEKHIGR